MNLLVYPFSKGTSYLMRGHLETLCDMRIIPVSPRAFGLQGKDTSTCDGGTPTSIHVRCDFDKALLESDAVLLVHAPFYNNPSDYIAKAEKAIRSSKSIYITESVLPHFAGHAVLLSSITIIQDSFTNNNNYTSQKLLSCDIPIVAVTGISDECDELLVASHIHYWFASKGYRVSEINSTEYAPLLGKHTFPKINNELLSYEEKVLMFNRYIYQISILEKPDIIILVIPKGILPLNPFIFDGFGDTIRLVCDATKIDIATVCLPSEKYNAEYLHTMKSIFKYRYGTDLCAALISPQILRINQETDQVSFVTSSFQYAKSCYNLSCSTGSIPIMLTQDPLALDSLCASIYSEITV